jgi:RNA polymerase-binding transcription factor DksA
MKKKTEKAKSDTIVACEQCGRKIPKERLKAVPDTTLCVRCAAEVESEHDTGPVISSSDFYDPGELLDAISSDD